MLVAGLSFGIPPDRGSMCVLRSGRSSGHPLRLDRDPLGRPVAHFHPVPNVIARPRLRRRLPHSLRSRPAPVVDRAVWSGASLVSRRREPPDTRRRADRTGWRSATVRETPTVAHGAGKAGNLRPHDPRVVADAEDGAGVDDHPEVNSGRPAASWTSLVNTMTRSGRLATCHPMRHGATDEQAPGDKHLGRHQTRLRAAPRDVLGR